MIGKAGQKLHERMVDEQRNRGKEWAANSKTLIAQAAKREGIRAATMAGALNDEERLDMFLTQAFQKYESPDQIKILKTSYVMRTSIEMLREAMLPIILRRTGTSKDPSGKTVLDLRPYKTVTAWAPLRENEQAELDYINQVHLERQNLRKRMLTAYPMALRRRQPRGGRWGHPQLDNFLLDQKDGGLHPEVSRLKQEEKVGGLKEGTLTNHIAKDWDRDNVMEKSSSRLMMTDKVIKHFWEGNPKTLIYHEDGTRDLEAEAALPDPPLLERPRKFLIYVHYKLHRTLLKKVLQICGRGLVEYDGTMSKSKCAAAIAKFESDDECQIMLISNVGAAGLNLTAASIVIFDVKNPQNAGFLHAGFLGDIPSLWRYRQLAEVSVIDIFAPRGLDLALAGYAGGKTLRCLPPDDLSKDNKDNKDNKEDRDEASPADLPQPKGSRVAKRKHKSATVAARSSDADSDDDEPAAPPAKKVKLKAKDAESTGAKKGRSRKVPSTASATSLKASAWSAVGGAPTSSLPADDQDMGPVTKRHRCDAGPSKRKPQTSKASSSTSVEQPVPKLIAAGLSKRKPTTSKASSSASVAQPASELTAERSYQVSQLHEPSGGASSDVSMLRSSPPVLPSPPAPCLALSGLLPPMLSPGSGPAKLPPPQPTQPGSIPLIQKRPRP
ncbi:hypothetical protein FRC06_005262 [Ceratobasidium sp. 370]|nr:hypothetical protein FRC06_005262 [Ceratobasidium sp. 370]